MELLQQEAMQLPLALGLLLFQQWAILTGSPGHSDKFNTDTQQFRDSLDADIKEIYLLKRAKKATTKFTRLNQVGGVN